MTAPCNVLVALVGVGGAPLVGASVTAQLTAPVVHDDVVLPMSVTAFTDASGQCVLPLYPSDVTTPATPYRFELVPPKSMRPVYFDNVIVPSAASVTLRQLLSGSTVVNTYIAADYVVADYVN